jgi:hypothetical protein
MRKEQMRQVEMRERGMEKRFNSTQEDIGVFVAVLDSKLLPNGRHIPAISAPGAQWLMQPALPQPPPHPDDVAALVRAFSPHNTSTPSAPRPPLSDSPAEYSCVSQDACIALRKLVDQAHTRTFSQTHSQQLHDQAGSCDTRPMRNSVADGVAAGSHEGDFKLLITLPELRTIVGDEACARVLSALEADAPDAIALRRTTASSRWINFHTDAAARTVQASAWSLDPCLVVVCDSWAGTADGRRRVRGRDAAVRVQ